MFRNIGDQIISVNSESLKNKSYPDAMRVLRAAMDFGKTNSSPITLKMRDIIASHRGHHPSYKVIDSAKLAAVVRQDYFPVLR